MSKPAIPIRATLAVVTRPDLWATGVRAALRFRPRRGGRLGPYVAFRLETQYGGGRQERRRAADPADVVAYLEWLRSVGPAGGGRRTR
ncbi:hypothetical protein [Candidatus Neomicrothrix sp.]|jgi:hypothetical protein|uniref:hypothetical protein n=1 Tax=Candidatus Neomicrothrix sp. TaxID=2719034 RepID=UPI001B6B6588|nr:hypothetical protein [Candidatus Microthrix sp.]MBK6439041.1 hypothetical protein [Candidatus Microthrix sp.]MBK6968033.1 hypothetical protein [Candidatus Microthrix sp.]MBK7165337.1 hypothetical protein [Candidatus Microthrix sp.]MBP7596601.1 hypothetical protein [Candidatus Microthrix sp.]MBP9064696.1 hypothetical protein [Candidatus Microthrix sp.]